MSTILTVVLEAGRLVLLSFVVGKDEDEEIQYSTLIAHLNINRKSFGRWPQSRSCFKKYRYHGIAFNRA